MLGSAIVIHSYIGFQACVIDYFPTWKYAGLRKAAEWALKGFTGLVLYGLYEYETSDVGITEGEFLELYSEVNVRLTYCRSQACLEGVESICSLSNIISRASFLH